MNCKCGKRLIEKLIEKCSEDIDGNEMVCKATFCDSGIIRKVCKSCMLYVIFLIIALMIIMGISIACFYFYWYMKGNYVNALSY